MLGKFFKFYMLTKLLGGSGSGRTGGKGGCGFGLLVLVLLVIVIIFAIRSCSGGAPAADF
ncbi:hypothetical protein H8S95_09040 [Pontibacter sp. KCTC 32443]|uniref:hypothetical protein n=1 Tax=Pontibacter TaxID=323449 RepID=UPI00164CE685|nr:MULTISPECIES: hypothetical protein [Pontibacter]MBC5774206.1 hypothetical protein [Pontibacter sp. KCTC 32443]